LAELRKGAFDLRAIDYVATPPKVEELKRLSMYLPGGSLVRRYDSLFHELRLDDRFIGQNEFWNGVFENPTLINGPILATATRTCICEDDEDVTEFLESISPGLSRSMTEERVQPERVATPVLEAPKEAVQLALLDVEDDEDDAADEEPEVADEVTDVESEATDEEADATDDEAETTPAKRLAKKPVKAAEKKKSTTAKAAAPKVAKKTVSKPAAKTTKAKAK
jgi:arsenate reductase-like glutaredoxin family protein